MVRRETADRQTRIEFELTEERAAALTRISSTLESLLQQLYELRTNMTETESPNPSAEVARYRTLRDQAILYRWYLEVQREALGLRPDSRLDEYFPIPAPL